MKLTKLVRYSSTPWSRKLFLEHLELTFFSLTCFRQLMRDAGHAIPLDPGPPDHGPRSANPFDPDAMQLVAVVQVVAGCYKVHHLPRRVLEQVLYDLMQYDHLDLAKYLYQATYRTAGQTRRGFALMREVKQGLQAALAGSAASVQRP